jgi:phenylacetate-CoA ligase
MLLNKIRNLAFNTIDLISGSSINNHYKDIKKFSEASTPKSIKWESEKRINELLTHAVNTTEFYKPFIDFKSLNDFPVIKKNVVQENFEKFRSKTYLNKKLYKVSTSGSTGVPFFLFQDMNKRKRNSADVIYYFNKSGYEIGNRLYEFEVWRAHNKKSNIKSFLQNICQFDVSKLNDERISLLFQILKKDNEPKVFLGFASAYETICQFIERNRENFIFDFNVKAIIANSEYLNDYTRETMCKFFNAPVYSRYSNEEIGLIAQQIQGSGYDFVINWASYYVELLDFNSDVPVEQGKPGRIVVTDLFNYCMPLIRFDTGDVGVFTNTYNGEMPNFKRVEGRKMDLIYDTSGNLVSSFVVYTIFYNYYKLLKQYQFIQLDKKEYLINLNLNQDSFEFEAELFKTIKADFGNDAIIKIQYVDEIPPLSSGKRKKVMSLYTKEKSAQKL